MILQNSNTKPCRNGEYCCCRCKHRYTVIVDGLFVGYVCYVPWFEKHVAMKIRNSGHDMCEGFEMVDNKL